MVERLVRKLAGRYGKLHFCYDAGPTGYGLYRQIEALGQTCLAVAPALIAKRPGERVKINRPDAERLARLHRAGELTGGGCRMRFTRRCVIWFAPARQRPMICAANASSCCPFCCGIGRVYRGSGHWTPAYGVGWPNKASIIPLSRSSSRRPSTRSRMPLSACAAWNSSWSKSCRAGRWRRWSKPTRQCAAPRFWLQ